MNYLLFCGDRKWIYPEPIRVILKEYDPDFFTIVHGGAQGADTLAGIEAKALCFQVRVFQAQWHQYGRSAGPIRNRAMLDLNPHKVYAFHNDIKKSKGTLDCIQEANRRGIEVCLIPWKNRAEQLAKLTKPVV